jgi:erythromycin esterase-like protein
MLAETGIPLLALKLPARGPVAEWFQDPHLTRTIGAVYSESNASKFFVNMVAPKSFDALFFINKTTAARENAEIAR